MATVTRYMTHYNSAADGYIELVSKAKGLADELFYGLKSQAEVTDKANLLAEYDKAMIDVESSRKALVVELYNDEAMTMAKVPGWKSRKSELRRGIKAGVDPTKFESFSSYRKAIDKATGGNSVGTSNLVKAPTGNGGSNASSEKDGSAPLTVVNSGLDKAVQDKLNLLAKHLMKLDTAQQLKVLADCDGQIHKLAKMGGRFSNVNRKTG